MPLTLTIENEPSLPDGGPLSVQVTGRRGIDIGRDAHLDWTLPDPSRAISGKHCEIRYYDGAYWLHDVSTNGTFVNRSPHRVKGPHRLRHGDRLEIGHYIIAVALDGEEAAAHVAEGPPPVQDPQALWNPVGQVAPLGQTKDFQPTRERRPVKPDFLDWAVDTAEPTPPAPAPPRAPADPSAWSEESFVPPPPASEAEEFGWAQAPRPRPPEPPPPVPTPRRPAGTTDLDATPWADPPPALPEPPRSAPEPAPTRAPESGFQRSSPPPVAAALIPTHASGDFVARFARGAGVPEELLARRDPGELAEEVGALLRLVAFEMKHLLGARAESKRLARSAEQTTIQALDNNPLKFSPTGDEALRIMFGPPSRGYLDARRAFEQSFKDVKVHQLKTYSAMQQALRALLAQIDPKVVDESLEEERGIGALIGSRKARLWDAYVQRWDAMAKPHDDGLLDLFMRHFADYYDKGAER
jgi:type VI secretion system protein ImpI